MRRFLTGMIFTLAVVAGAPVMATQTDPQLDALFSRLQATRDAGESEVLQNAIWSVWTTTDDKEAARMMAIGIIAMGQDRLDDALSTFDALVDLAPDFAEAWNKRATVHYLMGDLDASVADIEETLKLEPRHFGALSGLGLIYQDVEQWDAALRAFEAALKVNPHLPTVRASVESLRRKLRESTR